MDTKLNPDEIKVARSLWYQLKRGTPGAHKNLAATPMHIRKAVLQALVVAMQSRMIDYNPFG